ncbi:MAG: dynamin family protein [Acidimicrobiia bacterium]|nr:dynamin family protein [Acidimicrobiia bacterium]
MGEPAAIAIIDALEGLADALSSTGLKLDLNLAAEARATRDELTDQIGDYLIPRLKRLDAPVLAVLGGSTGSGKSTITNTLIGSDVTPAGVLRPTTRAPVLVCHPSDLTWFAGSDVLPDLARVTADRAEAGTVVGNVLRMVTAASLPTGLALIDAPDIDSVEEANRVLATQLLAAADLWLFATTAVRYADAVPWEFLRQAQARGTSLAVIINRIPGGATGEIVAHFTSMLDGAGLDGVAVFPIEQVEGTDGRLPPAAVAGIRTLLDTLATDAEKRAEVVARTLTGALNSILPRVEGVAVAGEEQNAAAAELRLSLEQTYIDARNDLGTDISGGNLLRGEVLDRWQELIGTAELMRAVQSRISWLRDRITAFATGRTGSTAEVQGEITSTLERLLVDHADKAALMAVTNWRNVPGGRQVLADDRSLERASDEFRSAIGAEIRAWQDDILELVQARGAGKRTTARVLAFGLNSVGVALMIVLFAQTGGLTGGEIAIGAGTAGLSQTLLTAIFGEQAVRELASDARRLLLDRVAALLDVDANRFRLRLWTVVSPPQATGDLRSALAAFERVR